MLDRRKQAQRTEAAQDAIAGRLSPPHDPAAERGVLAAIAWSQPARALAFEQLQAHHFYLPQHQHIYEAEKAVYTAGGEMDAMILKNKLKMLGTLEEAGGEVYVDEVLTSETSGLHIGEYLDILQEQHVARALHRLSRETLADIHAGGAVPSDVLNSTATEVNVLLGLGKHQEPVTVYDVFRTDVGRPIPTGYPTLDNILGGGFYPNQLIIIAARPSVGKSTFMKNIHRRMASRGVAAHVASIEETAEALFEKDLAAVSREDYRKIVARQLKDTKGEIIWSIDDPKHTHLIEAAAEIHGWKGQTEMCPTLSPNVWYSKMLRQRMLGQLDIGFVDYLQRMSDPATIKLFRGVTHEIVGAYSTRLKTISQELAIPAVALAQLNRNVEGRGDNEPYIADLGESGQVERDADVIILLYRPNEENEHHNLIVKVAKQRHGPVTWGEHNLKFKFDYVHQDITEAPPRPPQQGYKAIRPDPYA